MNNNTKNKKLSIKKLIISALLLAMGWTLPFLTGQIPQIGSMLLPMHLPVLICGFICGAEYGLPIGFILPLTRSLMFGSPPLYPQAVAMAFELATYGFLSGFLLHYCFKRHQNGGTAAVWTVYLSLVASMLGGRVIFGAVMTALMLFVGSAYSFELFLGAAFINAVPGIIVQLILIPPLVIALKRAKVEI